MRIVQVKTAVAQLNPEETAAIKKVCAQLRAVAPEMSALLQNANNLTLLMKFFELISARNDAFSIIRNAVATIKSAMEKDQTSTVAYLNGSQN